MHFMSDGVIEYMCSFFCFAWVHHTFCGLEKPYMEEGTQGRCTFFLGAMAPTIIFVLTHGKAGTLLVECRAPASGVDLIVGLVWGG